jgi:hypothetical protein
MEREHSIESVVEGIAAEHNLKKKEAPPQEVVYDKAIEAWGEFRNAQQYFQGRNKELIAALSYLLESAFGEDYREVIPPDPEYDEPITDEERARDHRNYLKALVTLEQYIKENKPMR